MTSDLIPTNISLGSTTIAPAGSLFVSWSILNQGSTAANASSTTELRITSSPTSAAGTNLAGVSTSALGAGASQFESAFLTAPTTPGTYYVWVIADDFSTVSNQSNTTNDLQHSIAFTVSPPPPPPPPAAQSDLIPTNISLGSTTIAPGGSLSVNWSILNQGSGAANSSSTTELRITSSPTATGTAADNLLGVSTSALGAGASQFESATLTAPTAPGTYYVWVIADDFSNVTNQSNTANDFQHSAAFTVSPPPPPLEPTLSSVSPSSYPASTSGQLMELFGSNFAVGDKLLYTFPSGATGFNLSPLTIVSSSEIDYSQFNDGSTPGTWKVQVEGPDGTLSSAVSFTVSPPPPPPPLEPTLSSVSPSLYPASSSGQLMELFGSNFAVGDKLLYTFPSGATGFNLNPLTVVSSSEIDYSQFNDGSTPGTWKVQVEGPDGTLSSAVSFTVSPPPASPSPPPPPPVSPPPPPPPPLLRSIPIQAAAGDLTINLELDGNAQNLASSDSHYLDDWKNAANILSSYIPVPVTVNIEVGYTEIPGSINSSYSAEKPGDASADPAYTETYTYSQLRDLLLSNGSSAVATAVYDLPNTPSLNGQNDLEVASAEAKVWKQIPATDTAVDGYAGFGAGISEDAMVGVALHEFTHAMGRVPGNSVLSLFRYTTVGQHDFGGTPFDLFGYIFPVGASYFSTDGGINHLADFGQNSDPSDFLNSALDVKQGDPSSELTPTDPFDEHYGSAEQSLTDPDKTMLQMLGFSGPVSGATFAVASLGDATAGSPISFRIYIKTPGYLTTSDYRIYYATGDGTAVGGMDYTNTSGFVDFTSANSTGYVDVTVPTELASSSSSKNFTFTITDYQHNALPNGVTTGVIDSSTPGEPQSTLPVTVGGTATISHGFLWSHDPDNTPGQLTYTILDKPTHGTVFDNGVATTSFTQADIDNGLVQYVENGDVASRDSFTFQLSDPAGNHTETEPFRIAILDRTGPVVEDNHALSASIGGDTTILNPYLDTVALDNSPDQIVYELLTQPQHGTLLLNGAAAGSFTQADVDNSRVVYAENGDVVGSDSLIFQVSDTAGNHTAPQTLSITIQGASRDLVWPSDGSGTDLLTSAGPATDQTFTFDDISALSAGPTDATTPSASDVLDPNGSVALDSELSSSDFAAYWDLLHPTSSSSGDCQG